MKFKIPGIWKFYKYEAKLATYPIIKFIDKHSNSCHGKLVDIGCGNKPYTKCFRYIDEYIGINIISDEAEVIANAKSLPIKCNSVDVVLCNQAIEHDAEPNKIIGEPNDFYRFTKWGLKYLLEKNALNIEVIEAHGGIFRAIGSHLNFFIIEFFGKTDLLQRICLEIQ